MKRNYNFLKDESETYQEDVYSDDDFTNQRILERKRRRNIRQKKNNPLFNEKSEFLKDAKSVYQEDAILGDYSSQWGSLTVNPRDVLHKKRKRNLYPLTENGEDINKKNKRFHDQGTRKSEKDILDTNIIVPQKMPSNYANRYALNYDTNGVLLGDPYAGSSYASLLQASLELPIGRKEAKAELKKRVKTNNNPVQLAMYEKKQEIGQVKERNLNDPANPQPQQQDNKDDDNGDDGVDDGIREEASEADSSEITDGISDFEYEAEDDFNGMMKKVDAKSEEIATRTGEVMVVAKQVELAGIGTVTVSADETHYFDPIQTPKITANPTPYNSPKMGGKGNIVGRGSSKNVMGSPKQASRTREPKSMKKARSKKTGKGQKGRGMRRK